MALRLVEKRMRESFERYATKNYFNLQREFGAGSSCYINALTQACWQAYMQAWGVAKKFSRAARKKELSK